MPRKRLLSTGVSYSASDVALHDRSYVTGPHDGDDFGHLPPLDGIPLRFNAAVDRIKALQLECTDCTNSILEIRTAVADLSSRMREMTQSLADLDTRIEGKVESASNGIAEIREVARVALRALLPSSRVGTKGPEDSHTAAAERFCGVNGAPSHTQAPMLRNVGVNILAHSDWCEDHVKDVKNETHYQILLHGRLNPPALAASMTNYCQHRWARGGYTWIVSAEPETIRKAFDARHDSWLELVVQSDNTPDTLLALVRRVA